MDEILDKIPDDQEYIEDVKKYFNRNKINIVENKEYKTSIYNFLNNTITIANMQKKQDKILVLVHEFIHSMQPQWLHFMNFILSNSEIILFLYTIYLLIIGKFDFNYGALYISTVIPSIIVRTIMEYHAVSNSLKIVKKILKKYISDYEIKVLYNYYDNTVKKYSLLFYLQLNIGKLIRLFIILIAYLNVSNLI